MGLERQLVALLDLRAPLQEAKRDLGGLHLRRPQGARSPRPAGLGSSARSAVSSAARASARAAPTSPSNRWPQLRKARIRAGARVVVRRLGQRRLAALDHLAGWVLSVEAGAKRMSARSTPEGTSVRSCSRIAVARSGSPGEAMEVRRVQSPLPNQRRDHQASSSAASSKSSAAAAVAPGQRPAGSNFECGGNGGVGALGRECEVAGPLLEIGHGAGQSAMHHTALPRGRLFVADRGEQRMREAKAGVVELDDALTDGLRRGPGGPVRRSPWARATRSMVGLANADAWRRTSSVSAGKRARRPPSSSRRLSGTRSARPGAGRVSVRASSRPSSSPKKGLPADVSCTRASSGRVNSRASRSLEHAMQRARAERPHRELPEPLGWKRAVELERGRRLAR